MLYKVKRSLLISNFVSQMYLFCGPQIKKKKKGNFSNDVSPLFEQCCTTLMKDFENNLYVVDCPYRETFLIQLKIWAPQDKNIKFCIF